MHHAIRPDEPRLPSELTQTSSRRTFRADIEPRLYMLADPAVLFLDVSKRQAYILFLFHVSLRLRCSELLLQKSLAQS